MTGIEPVTQGFSVLCSTNWATSPKLEGAKVLFFYIPYKKQIIFFLIPIIIALYLEIEGFIAYNKEDALSNLKGNSIL